MPVPSFHWPAENDVVGEERNPFLGLGVITVTPAHQFMFPIGPSDPPSLAEAVDDFVADVAYFHAPQSPAQRCKERNRGNESRRNCYGVKC